MRTCGLVFLPYLLARCATGAAPRRKSRRLAELAPKGRGLSQKYRSIWRFRARTGKRVQFGNLVFDHQMERTRPGLPLDCSLVCSRPTLGAAVLCEVLSFLSCLSDGVGGPWFNSAGGLPGFSPPQITQDIIVHSFKLIRVWLCLSIPVVHYVLRRSFCFGIMIPNLSKFRPPLISSFGCCTLAPRPDYAGTRRARPEPGAFSTPAPDRDLDRNRS